MTHYLIPRKGKEIAQSPSSAGWFRQRSYPVAITLTVAFLCIGASAVKTSSLSLPLPQTIIDTPCIRPTTHKTTEARDLGKFAYLVPGSRDALSHRDAVYEPNSSDSTSYDLSDAATILPKKDDTSFLAAAQSASPARLLNISARTRVQTGENVLIAGFIISGSGSKRVVLRGIGPSLGAAGVHGLLADPVLELHKPDGTVITNDNWNTARADVQITGLPPTNDKESAIVANLPAGSYTAILRGRNNTGGIGLVEIYDINATAAAELMNISSRGFVATGDNVLIGGIIVGPFGSIGSKVLVRAIGPSLARFGITNPLLDPTLEVHNKDGALVAANNDWKDTQRTAIQATKAFPSDDRESAIVFTAASGNYTTIVRGRNNTTGLALVEVYNLH